MSGITSQEFICICGKQKGWITEGERTSPCPVCGRVYEGKYNEDRLCIEAVVIEKEAR